MITHLGYGRHINGCAFADAFSFIDSDQLVAFGRGIAQNATGFAFELALETISPVIAETMAKLRALAQWVNNQNLNSCETAQALVGAAWSRNDRASAAIRAATDTSQCLAHKELLFFSVLRSVWSGVGRWR